MSPSFASCRIRASAGFAGWSIRQSGCSYSFRKVIQSTTILQSQSETMILYYDARDNAEIVLIE
jgi:hypothetical protein